MTVGLVLSGGGVKGAAHIGAIKALEEYGIHATHVAGTSAGAIVGSLHAAGVGWSEILDFFETVEIFRTTKYAYRKPGFIDTEKFYEPFRRFLPDDRFEALQKNFFCTATDIVEGSLKIFDRGELIKPVLASASFPGVFTPTEIAGSYYIDGGTLNNFPIEPLVERCDKIIGVHVNPLKKCGVEDLRSAYQIVDRAYKVMFYAASMIKFDLCDMLVCPPELEEFSMFEMYKAPAIFELGYAATIELLRDNDELVHQLGGFPPSTNSGQGGDLV